MYILLYHSNIKGASYIYLKLIRPFLKYFENVIDEKIDVIFLILLIYNYYNKIDIFL
jgi:hypothetical protein